MPDSPEPGPTSISGYRPGFYRSWRAEAEADERTLGDYVRVLIEEGREARKRSR
jgi:hypothetical protein